MKRLITMAFLSFFTFPFFGCEKNDLVKNGSIDVTDDVIDSDLSLKLTSNYKETINDSKIQKNVVTDYKMKSSDELDQSSLLQNAIDDVSQKGGGRLIIPKGTYRFINVAMKSNVHILVEEGTVFKPYWANKTINASGVLNIGIMLNFGSQLDENKNYTQCVNSSIRGMNRKKYTVDYSEVPVGDKTQIRFIILRWVKNFFIADVDIMDNFTKFCGIIFVPTSNNEIDGCPTDGKVIDCSIFNANSGYGLCQFHAAKSLYFENIYAKGGVTFRLEPDIVSPNQGLFDLHAKNVKNECGRAGVLMQPHTIDNGTIKVDGVWTKSSSFGVLVKRGFIDDQNADNPNATIGRYADDSEIVNIHALYGTDAQVDDKEVWIMEPDDAKYALFRNNSYKNPSSFDGPSITPVYDETKGSYKVTYKNITSEGFDHHKIFPLYYEEIKERENDKWKIVNALPNATRAVKSRSAKKNTEKPHKFLNKKTVNK